MARNGNWITAKKRCAIYKRDQYRCVYCNRTLNSGELTLDHLLAYQLGGSNCHTNLVTACKWCNSSKGKKLLEEFLAELTLRGVDTKALRNRINGRRRKKLPFRRLR